MRVVDNAREGSGRSVRLSRQLTQRVGSSISTRSSGFAARAATTEDKRAAVVALAGALEERLPIIKECPHLTSRDGADLFNIANNFALRHQDIKQKREYHPIFLDWMFWWFLAAIEVTDHTLANHLQPTGP